VVIAGLERARLAEHDEVGEAILRVRPERPEQIEPLGEELGGVRRRDVRAQEADHELEPGRVGDTQERSDRRNAVAGLEGGERRLRRTDRVREARCDRPESSRTTRMR
jgi:hypothetical protein